MARKIEFIVDNKYAGKTISAFLRRELKASASLLASLKRMENGIIIDGADAKNIYVLLGGEHLTVYLPESFSERGGSSNIAPSDLHVELVYHDEDYAIFDKPKNLPVHPSRAHVYDTLANDFMHKFPGTVFRPLSRLDIDTVGLVPVAKNKAAASLSPSKIHKIYYGVTGALVTGTRFTLSAPIERKEMFSPERTVRSDGKPSITKVRKIAVKNGKTLLRFELMTGRTHQIRVHCAHMSSPLLGDTLYGGRELTPEEKAVLGGGGQALAAAFLRFTNPITGKKITARSGFLKGLIQLLDIPENDCAG